MEQGGTGRTVHEQHARTTPVRPRVPARQRAPAGRCPCPGLPGSGCLRAGRIDGRTVPPCSGSLLGRSAWGPLGAGFAFRVRSDSFDVYGPATDHAYRVLLLISLMYEFISAPVSPTIADSFGIAFKGASAPAPGPSPRPSAHLTPICISRRALWRACGVSTPFPHLCYDLGVPPRPPPLHERVHAAIGMLRVPPSPCESLPRQAYGYSLTVLHAAARAAHLTGSAEDARASSLSRHMRP
jgi:hypothetical protein